MIINVKDNRCSDSPSRKSGTKKASHETNEILVLPVRSEGCKERGFLASVFRRQAFPPPKDQQIRAQLLQDSSAEYPQIEQQRAETVLGPGGLRLSVCSVGISASIVLWLVILCGATIEA